MEKGDPVAPNRARPWQSRAGEDAKRRRHVHGRWPSPLPSRKREREQEALDTVAVPQAGEGAIPIKVPATAAAMV